MESSAVYNRMRAAAEAEQTQQSERNRIGRGCKFKWKGSGYE